MRSGNVFIFTFNGVNGSDGNNVYTITNQNYLPNVVSRGIVCIADGSDVKRVFCDPVNGIIKISSGTANAGYYGNMIWTRY